MSGGGTRTAAKGNLLVLEGGWRWGALGFVVVALTSGLLSVAAPSLARWAGLLLLVAIAGVALLFLYTVWPRSKPAIPAVATRADTGSRANIAWALTAADGTVLECNDRYRRMAGIGEVEMPPPPELALSGEPRAAILKKLARAAQERQASEEYIPVGDGRELLVAVRPLPGGQAAWWFAPRAAGSQKEAGRPAAAPSALAVPSLLSDAPLGVALVAENGVITEANAAFERFFGAGKIAGRPLADLVDPADRQKVAERIGRNGAGAPGAVELRAATGGERMGELYASATSGQSGRVILYLVDVSEQRALETKFAQSQKMQAVGQLAGGVAHDFNNLLTVIIGNSEFLLMRHQAGDPSFKEINEIHQNGLRAATLVGQLLAFSRKQTLQPRTLALGDAIGELAVMLRRLLREGLTLKLENQSGLWPVHADEAQFSNALINLVVNARDAMPNGGAITIRTANETVAHAAAFGTAIMPPGDYVRVDVADAGTGIAKEHLGKIFDPFFTTKAVGQGTGLGLATVYGIVKQTGGFITVDSDPGKGTTFRIYLPRHRAETGAESTPEAEHAPRDVTGQDTILLVEDEEAVRSFAARALRMRGYNVLEAPGGEEALETMRARTNDIDLLITDVVMPNMDGPTLVRAVKQLRPDMAVIFMSGYAEEAFRRNDEKAEDLHFLPKPFGLKQLAAKVKDVLSSAPAGRA